MCANSELLRSSLELRGAALLALTKLMVVDEAFCSDNLARLFWLFRNSTCVRFGAGFVLPKRAP